MKLTFPQYVKYIKFTHNEEIERMKEFLSAVDRNEEVSSDMYYIEAPSANFIPDKEFVEEVLGDRSVKLDFSVMDSQEDVAGKEVLWLHLRDLFNS